MINQFETQISNYKKLIYKYIVALFFLVIIFLILWNYYFKNNYKFQSFEYSFTQIEKFYLNVLDIIWVNIPEKKVEKINTNFYPTLASDKKVDEIIKNFQANSDFLNWELDKSLLNLNWNDLNYFFNQWNILFAKSMQFSSGGNVNDLLSWYSYLKDSLSSYEQISTIIITGKDEKFEKQFDYNFSVLKTFLYLLNVKLCTNVFSGLVLSLDNISNSIDQQLSWFEQKIKDIDNFKLWITDQELLKCLDDYKKNLTDSYLWLLKLKDFISITKSSIPSRISDSLNEKLNCFEQKTEVIDGINNSVWEIKSVLDQFIQMQQSIWDIIKKQDMDWLHMICKNPWWGWKSWDESSEKLNKWMEQLDKIVNQNKQKSEDQSNQENNWEKENQNNDDDKKSANKPQHQNIDPAQSQQIIDNVKRKSTQWIDQMQEIKWSGTYNSSDYIRSLFKEFLWNWDDFKQSWDEGNWTNYDRKR